MGVVAHYNKIPTFSSSGATSKYNYQILAERYPPSP